MLCNKMKPIPIGAIYLIEIIQTFENPKLTAPLFVASLIALSVPQTQATKILSKNALKGRRIFSAKKLIESKKFIPLINVTSPKAPFANDDGTPIRNATKPNIITAFFLCHLCSSTKYVTAASNNDIEDVNAANKTNMKNKTPNNDPIGIFANTPGNVINNNPGPAEGLYPSANTAGNTAKADNNAAAESINGI